MTQRRILQPLHRQLKCSLRSSQQCASRHIHSSSRSIAISTRPKSSYPSRFAWKHTPQYRSFSITSSISAQPPTADAVMENLNDLYATAKDEFEMCAEETEKKTIYAADDREAAKEAFALLKEAYEKAVKECDPETAKEVQTRTGPRIKELENALAAVEEMAMED